eukprot:TRINITY_DN17614_c0_g1_i3.p1 TRINITY_DN17614_c0_g1~~TRINITY_DN17614_c0_g1_i3.p1  ORF type:complete len:243 (-),score=36.67 TRINITY_DN17614_c0_g1_i3:147-875(-)
MSPSRASMGRRSLSRRQRAKLRLLRAVAALGTACVWLSGSSDTGFAPGLTPYAAAGRTGLRPYRCGPRASCTAGQITRRSFGGRGRGPMAEPEWLGTAFFGIILLSFIPGPWQIILSPIISLINLFYMFKFGIFFLGIAAVFGMQWYLDSTTCEGMCPNCGTPQRGSKSEPFGCPVCGEALEVKDDTFVRYLKSGKAESTPYEAVRDFAKQAVERQASTANPSTSSGMAGKKKIEVVDVEVL